MRSHMSGACAPSYSPYDTSKESPPPPFFFSASILD
jgi:hypothetical protein